MFLDDINRDIHRKRNLGEYWDWFQSIDFKDEETVVAFIPRVKLFFIRNTGDLSVNLALDKFQTKLLPGEEKSFHHPSGVQAVLYAPRPGAKVFVAQSTSGDTQRPKYFCLIFLLLSGIFCILGCLQGSPMPRGQRVAKTPPLIKTPQTPKGVLLPKTPDV